MRAPRKYLIVLFFMTAVGARHAVPLHAQTQQTECPPECTIDTMEIVTWYPSPYNEYEELRLYPTQRDANYCDNDKIGLMYYDHGGTPSFPDNDKMMICKGTLLGWQEVGGGNVEFGSSGACDSNNQGKMVYDERRLLFCNGIDWQAIDLIDLNLNAPVLLSISRTSQNSILLKWSGSNTGFYYYEIYRSTNTNPTAILTTVEGNNSEYIDTDLSPSADRYYYRLKAINSYFKSDFSNELSVYHCPSSWTDSHVSTCSGNMTRSFGYISAEECYNQVKASGSPCAVRAYSSGSTYMCYSFSGVMDVGCGACSQGDLARNICQ